MAHQLYNSKVNPGNYLCLVLQQTFYIKLCSVRGWQTKETTAGCAASWFFQLQSCKFCMLTYSSTAFSFGHPLFQFCLPILAYTFLTTNRLHPIIRAIAPLFYQESQRGDNSQILGDDNSYKISFFLIPQTPLLGITLLSPPRYWIKVLHE